MRQTVANMGHQSECNLADMERLSQFTWANGPGILIHTDRSTVLQQPAVSIITSHVTQTWVRVQTLGIPLCMQGLHLLAYTHASLSVFGLVSLG